MMRKLYFEYVKELTQKRGIGGKLSRCELVIYGIKTYKPDAYDKKNTSIRSTTDKLLRDLKKMGYIRSTERGKNVIIKPILCNFKTFSLKCKEKSKAKKSLSKSS